MHRRKQIDGISPSLGSLSAPAFADSTCAHHLAANDPTACLAGMPYVTYEWRPPRYSATLVHAFPPSADINSSLGIDEYEDDVFVFNAGQVTGGDRAPIAGSWGVWTIDLRNWTAPADNSSALTPHVTQIAQLPAAGLLNGLAVLNPATTTGPRAKGSSSSPTALLADSTAGIIYSLPLKSTDPTVEIFYSNPDLLAPTKNSTFPTGLNGLQVPPVRNPKHVYFTSGFRGSFYRIALSQTSPAIRPGAELELLAQGYTNLDDFALEADGTAYLSTSTTSQVVRVTPDGDESVLIQSELVESGTATYLMEQDGKKVLYVNTGGAVGLGTSAPGKLVEIWL
ncbi:hypothetical protein ACET3X_008629 [Alternaria dauci]|uniref:Calcium-dependent phosphotriesterase n=1 Tax=Alternaria dauci TaxID=48095 RepID=A0ABR3UBU9_9PLEO